MTRWNKIGGVVVAAGALFAQAAAAQTWPTRSVTMVVPFAAGSASDTVGRIVATRMSELLGQQVVIENIGGAGGMTGAARVAKAPADGYQFVMGGLDTFAQGPALYKKSFYNPVSDFVPVALIADQPLVLLVRKDLPASNLAEFIAYAKANQGKMQYGSSGVGSGSQLTCAQLNAAMGVDITHVPYRGSGPAMQDLIAGRIDYFCALGAAAMPQLASNNLKAVAVLTRERSPLFPGLATAHEQGLKDFDSYFWGAIFYPKGTPDDIVRRLQEVSAAALDTPSIQERLKVVGATAVPPERRSSEYLRTFLDAELAKWTAIIKTSGISLD
jgi:tripartite-type tricarboxylate transporter receptor subunit TctC